MIKCPNTDCEYRGYDGCYKSIELVDNGNGGLRCIDYTPRVAAKDLNTFNSNCHKERNRFKSNSHKTYK